MECSISHAAFLAMLNFTQSFVQYRQQQVSIFLCEAHWWFNLQYIAVWSISRDNHKILLCSWKINKTKFSFTVRKLYPGPLRQSLRILDYREITIPNRHSKKVAAWSGLYIKTWKNFQVLGYACKNHQKNY